MKVNKIISEGIKKNGTKLIKLKGRVAGIHAFL